MSQLTETRAWAVVTPWQGPILFTVAHTRAAAISQFVELMDGIKPGLWRGHLTTEQSRIWRQHKRKRQARTVKVRVQMIEREST